MSRRVGIVAVAKTKYQASRPDVDMAELAYESIEQVVQKSGLTFANNTIDAAVTCSQDLDDGQTISDNRVTDVVGGQGRGEAKVADDGVAALCLAAMQVMSGHYNTILVMAHTKESISERRPIENFGFDPICSQGLGLDFLSASAMQARLYMHDYAITPEQCAQVVVKNLKNAKGNRHALTAGDVSTSLVLSSRMLCSPIRELEAKPVVDGSCAMIIADEDTTRKHTDRPVWIKGFGNCYDNHYMGYRNLSRSDSLRMAAQEAYKMAGIKRPSKEIDFAEVSEYYSYQELLWCEELGFCSVGNGGQFIESGASQIGGRMPVNPSGGLLSGVPVNVAGLDRIAEAVLQLRGEAEGHQVKRARVALAQGFAGACGQLQSVMVLGKE